MNHAIRTILLDFSAGRRQIQAQLDRFKAVIDVAGRTPDVILAAEYTQWFSDLKGSFGSVASFAQSQGVDILLTPMGDHKSRTNTWQSARNALMQNGALVEAVAIPARAYVASIGLWFDREGGIYGFVKNRRFSVHPIPGHQGLGVSICYELACMNGTDLRGDLSLILSPARYGAFDSPIEPSIRKMLEIKGITAVRCDGDSPTPGLNLGVIVGDKEKLLASGDDWRLIELGIGDR